MKKKAMGFLALSVVPVLAIGYWTYGTLSEGVTVAAFSKIQDSRPPLRTDDVVKLLGQPSRIEQSENTGVTGEVYYYPWRNNEMKIVFVNGAVFHAEYTSQKQS